MRHPETTSQSERGFRDVLSAWAAIGKACPGLRCQGVFFTPAPCSEFDSPRFGACVGAGHGQPELNRHRIYIWSRLCAENPRICFANPHRLRPPAGALARSLQTLRVCLTLAPCIEFDSPRCGLEIKRQVETLLYLPVTYGGALAPSVELSFSRIPSTSSRNCLVISISCLPALKNRTARSS